MEEVPAHVHPDPIVPDVLTRQHEHRLIGVQLSLTHFSGCKVKKEPLEAWILREFTDSKTDDDLILRAHGFIFLLLGVRIAAYHNRGLVQSDLWWAEVPLIYYEIMEYQHPGREVDDMATGVIQGPPSSPTKITSFAKKVQTIIHKCMQLRRRHQEPVLDHGARGVKRDTRRLPGGGAHGDRTPSPPHPGRRGHPRSMPFFSLGLIPPAQSHPGTLGTSYAPPPPGLGFSSTSPPMGTVGSSTPHMPKSYASLSGSNEHDDERIDDVTPVQQLGFGHRVGKKTTRFTPSDQP
ncbi:hypothetical protein M9H77_36466 [Catharanthus roseus]|uniref:Uncharacterized protein n=1 Tax=Catharanthus roseus TaxID=4058 RepID=A0ACB9ZT65_CATRO|nr:hypothetical protein M9H77_36466 [Catharanthus roseus]